MTTLYFFSIPLYICVGIFVHHLYTVHKNGKITSFYQMNSFFKEASVILDEVRMNTKLVNALLLHAHNGGNQLYANGFNKSSVLEESPEFPEVAVLNNWKNRPIDRYYRNLLHEVETEIVVPIEYEKVAGDLAAIYLMYSIKGALVFKIYNKTKASFFYASFVSQIPVKEIRYHKDYARILIGVQKLTELCARYHKSGVLK